MEALVWIGFGWWSASTIVHWLSAALARWPRPPIAAHDQASDFSIVAPMNGAADASAGLTLGDGIADAPEAALSQKSGEDGKPCPAATRASRIAFVPLMPSSFILLPDISPWP